MQVMAQLNKVCFIMLCWFFWQDSHAATPDFAGHWSIDIRTPQERKQHLECGNAQFSLKQVGDRIIGSHSFATVGCGRLNEGDENSVHGFVVGNTAVLVVKSERNSAMVLGKATRRANQLDWSIVEEISPGEPEGDSPLILAKGTLELDAKLSR